MNKPIIDENQHIEILNERLKAHPDYQEDMKVVGVPKGYSGGDLSGYETEGPGPVRGIVADIDNAVREEYDIKGSPRDTD